MQGDEIRQAFLDYFAQRGHTVVPSSSLVPLTDPTLLFTNAGMVQFKPVFLGEEARDYKRAASSQKCVRAGGKHNDLENVGRTARHHTFFEMLGNFSFGDYFKEEACAFAWELVTGPYGLDPEDLWVSVYEDDDEAAFIWRDKVGVAGDRIVRFGEKDNFWSMGETGPCGPCSEIYIDRGPEKGCGEPGCVVGCECDRFVEIWNLVFMQYNRDKAGTMTPLPRPSIDTGLGLERMAMVKQGADTNYDTDLFLPIIRRAAELAGVDYGADHEKDVSLRVVADHIRSTSFLIADGVLPGNVGRGYVLRRIMRRAIRHGRKLGLTRPFLGEVSESLVGIMGHVYADLVEQKAFIKKVILREEEQFLRTLDDGLRILREELDRLPEGEGGRKVLPGGAAFKLHATYGFPVDLTSTIGEEEGFVVDYEGYEKHLTEHQEASAGAETGPTSEKDVIQAVEGLSSLFTGYEEETTRAKITALLQGGRRVEKASEGEEVVLAAERTPFYGESGGQTGDLGLIKGEGFEVRVTDSKKPRGDLTLHYGRVMAGEVREGAEATLQVDHEARQATRLNHSATHLLHHALRRVLGSHVKQAGSLVDPKRLRFDFSNPGPLTPGEMQRVERIVNQVVRENHDVVTRETSYDEAVKEGAMALFGEKYGDKVRLVRMGPSAELCGGTHAARTGDIGLFRLASEGGIAGGVRRIEAFTGREAFEAARRDREEIERIAERLKTTPQEAPERVEKLLVRQKELEREVENLKSKLAGAVFKDASEEAEEINGVRAVVRRLDGADQKAMRDQADKIRDKLGSGVVCLGSETEGKAMLIVACTKDVAGKRCHAGNLVKELAPLIGGRGGGRPDFAQAGGGEPAGLDQALARFKELL